MEKFIQILKIIFGYLAMTLVAAAIAAIPTQAIWNYLMPELFGLKQITLWQAFLMVCLSAILFGSGIPNATAKSV